jgi:hypothetical protein
MQTAKPALLVATALAAATLAPQDPGWELSTPRTVDGDVPVRAEGLDALDCARCHREVAEEWATTLHAFAWVDPFYREELEGRRRPQACHACHIPQPVHLTGLGEKPVPREDDLHLGVTCASCHLGPDGTMLGPRGTPTDAHPTAQAQSFVGAGANALCSTCHDTFVGPVIGLAQDFAASEQAAGGATCVGCHMAEVERRWANVPPDTDGEPAPLRKGRSHALQTPRDPSFLRRGLALSVRAEEGAAVLVVANAAGHRVPGLIGRVLELEVQLVDETGAEVFSEEVVIDSQTPLKPDEPWEIELSGTGAAVIVKGTHVDPRTLDEVPFLDERVEVAR